MPLCVGVLTVSFKDKAIAVSFSFFLTALIPALAAFTAGSLAIYAWQRREVTGARSFALCSASIFIWCFFAVFEQLAVSESARITFGLLQYFGISFFPIFWLLFSLRYAQHDSWLTRNLIVSVSFIPVVTLTLALSNHWHGWIWQQATLVLDPYPHLAIVHGWWFTHVMIPQSYALLIAGVGVLLGALFSGSSRLYKRQTLLVLVAALAPFICNVLYVVSGITLYGLDLTPVGFVIAGLCIQLGLSQTRFLEVSPISYKTVFLNTTDAVILLDAHRRIVDLNPSANRERRQRVANSTSPNKRPIKQHSREKRLKGNDAIGRSFEQVFPQYDEIAREAIFWETEPQLRVDELTRTVQIPSCSQLLGKPQMTYREVKVRSLYVPEKSLKSRAQQRVGWVIMIRDITLGKLQQVKLEQLAYVDSLTGLYNRRQLELEMQSILQQMQQLAVEPSETSATNPSSYSVALLYVDLNQFKPINDNYGHEVGDKVLKHFGHCLKRSVRSGDMTVRLGGDEFAALLYQADLKVAIEVRNRLCTLLKTTVSIAGHYFTLSASVGIACYPNDGTSLKELLNYADQQMYKEKHLLKDTYR